MQRRKFRIDVHFQISMLPKYMIPKNLPLMEVLPQADQGTRVDAERWPAHVKFARIAFRAENAGVT